MICPNCGTHVSDDALRCPACRCDLGRTTALPRPQGVWCALAGAFVQSENL
ncbi:zinc-ribbon domain-containing protein [Olsenella massiliensis]|uniref:zinc-ribbon domain-containing protein n=1 Tax=Olsenella massiliensis TaxID=1622075 RepID=UPI000A436A1E|nr:zinc-ribbon domain-containing protein [Olsenella massiliensis]